MYPIHIAFVADKKYFQYVAVSVYSILKNAAPDDDLHFYVASPDAGGGGAAFLSRCPL